MPCEASSDTSGNRPRSDGQWSKLVVSVQNLWLITQFPFLGVCWFAHLPEFELSTWLWVHISGHTSLDKWCPNWESCDLGWSGICPLGLGLAWIAQHLDLEWISDHHQFQWSQGRKRIMQRNTEKRMLILMWTQLGVIWDMIRGHKGGGLRKTDGWRHYIGLLELKTEKAKNSTPAHPPHHAVRLLTPSLPHWMFDEITTPSQASPSVLLDEITACSWDFWGAPAHHNHHQAAQHNTLSLHWMGDEIITLKSLAGHWMNSLFLLQPRVCDRNSPSHLPTTLSSPCAAEHTSHSHLLALRIASSPQDWSGIASSPRDSRVWDRLFSSDNWSGSSSSPWDWSRIATPPLPQLTQDHLFSSRLVQDRHLLLADWPRIASSPRDWSGITISSSRLVWDHLSSLRLVQDCLLLLEIGLGSQWWGKGLKSSVPATKSFITTLLLETGPGLPFLLKTGPGITSSPQDWSRIATSSPSDWSRITTPPWDWSGIASSPQDWSRITSPPWDWSRILLLQWHLLLTTGPGSPFLLEIGQGDHCSLAPAGHSHIISMDIGWDHQTLTELTGCWVRLLLPLRLLSLHHFIGSFKVIAHDSAALLFGCEQHASLPLLQHWMDTVLALLLHSCPLIHCLWTLSFPSCPLTQLTKV